MDFSLDVLYNMEKEVDSVFGAVFGVDWTNISKAAVMKNDKERWQILFYLLLVFWVGARRL